MGPKKRAAKDASNDAKEPKKSTGPTGGAHNDVTAESLHRRARAHGAKAMEHRDYAAKFMCATIEGAVQKAKHEACALMHAESQVILSEEAERILGQFKRKQ